jgi:ribose transport system permease protein
VRTTSVRLAALSPSVSGGWWTRLPVLQLAVLLAAWAIGVVTIPAFGDWQSTRLLLVLAAVLGLASVGQTFLILCGGFDLSVPGFIVAGALLVSSIGEQWGLSILEALLVALAAAALLGGLGGYVCHRFSINPLVVTLAIGTIALGLVQAAGAISSAAGAPNEIAVFASPTSQTFGINLPPVVASWLVVGVVASLFLHRTIAGRRLLATGANLHSAENSLINTRRVWIAAFAFSAICSVIAGLAVAGFGGGIDVTSGDPYLFLSVVSVLIGGTIFGGPGDYFRTMVGALLVTVVNAELLAYGLGPDVQQMLFGALMILAVSAYGRQRRIRDRI